MQDYRPRGPGFKPQCGQKENLSQVQSEQYHHQSLCTRVKYLKLSEVKTRSRHGALVECRTRDPEVPGSNPSGSLVLHSTTVPWQLLVFTSDNFRYLTLVQRDWWWYCSDWTCESVAKKKISHRSNQNNTTTNPSAPELHT